MHQKPPITFVEVSCATVQFAIKATGHSQHNFSPVEMAYYGRNTHNTHNPFCTQMNWDKILMQNTF